MEREREAVGNRQLRVGGGMERVGREMGKKRENKNGGGKESPWQWSHALRSPGTRNAKH